MKDFNMGDNGSGRRSTAIGLALTAALHIAGAAVCYTNGLKYLDPPPPETTFLMDYTTVEELPAPKPKPRGTAPRAAEVDKTRPVEIVQKSESPYSEPVKENLTPQTADDTFGDVPIPETKQEEPKLDPRASFRGMAKKDTTLTAPHSAQKPTSTFKAGQPDGNSKDGPHDGKPTAHLQGRGVINGLARPEYNVQASGIVVVNIWVDQEGMVTRAEAGADGTTVTDKTLWVAARKAAIATHFEKKIDAPPVQQGKITYYFNLK